MKKFLNNLFYNRLIFRHGEVPHGIGASNSAKKPTNNVQAGINAIKKQLDTLDRTLTKNDHKITRNLNLTDIVSDPAHLGVTDRRRNPQYNMFGTFQEAFYQALKDPSKREVKAKGDWFYEKEEADGGKRGYYVSEVSVTESGINTQDPKYDNEKTIEVLKKMSYDKAVQRFQKLGLPVDFIKRYIYQVHAIQKTNPATKKIEKYYAFWTMPTFTKLPEYENPHGYK